MRLLGRGQQPLRLRCGARRQAQSGRRLAVSLTLPVSPSGLSVPALAAVRAMVAAGVALVPTLAIVNLMQGAYEQLGVPASVVPRLADVEDAMSRSIVLARATGVTIGSGSDLLGSRQNRRGLELTLKARILGAMEAIVSATATNARIMRIADRAGTLEEGKWADAIAVDGDPLAEPELFDDPARVVFVMKAGVVVKDTR